MCAVLGPNLKVCWKRSSWNSFVHRPQQHHQPSWLPAWWQSAEAVPCVTNRRRNRGASDYLARANGGLILRTQVRQRSGCCGTPQPNPEGHRLKKKKVDNMTSCHRRPITYSQIWAATDEEDDWVQCRREGTPPLLSPSMVTFQGFGRITLQEWGNPSEALKGHPSRLHLCASSLSCSSPPSRQPSSLPSREGFKGNHSRVTLPKP